MGEAERRLLKACREEAEKLPREEREKLLERCERAFGEYNLFGHFGVLVTSPEIVIKFKGEEWGTNGSLSLGDLANGIPLMKGVPLSKIEEFYRENAEELVTIEERLPKVTVMRLKELAPYAGVKL
jgi:hypothetical protein